MTRIFITIMLLMVSCKNSTNTAIKNASHDDASNRVEKASTSNQDINKSNTPKTNESKQNSNTVIKDTNQDSKETIKPNITSMKEHFDPICRNALPSYSLTSKFAYQLRGVIPKEEKIDFSQAKEEILKVIGFKGKNDNITLNYAGFVLNVLYTQVITIELHRGIALQLVFEEEVINMTTERNTYDFRVFDSYGRPCDANNPEPTIYPESDTLKGDACYIRVGKDYDNITIIQLNDSIAYFSSNPKHRKTGSLYLSVKKIGSEKPRCERIYLPRIENQNKCSSDYFTYATHLYKTDSRAFHLNWEVAISKELNDEFTNYRSFKNIPRYSGMIISSPIQNQNIEKSCQ